MLQTNDGRFVSVDSQNQVVIGGKDLAKATRFAVVCLGDGRIALFREEGYLFVSNDLNLSAHLFANRQWCQVWEWFRAVPQSQNQKRPGPDNQDGLQALVGMNEVKREIIELERFLQVQLERKRRGSRAPSLSMHIALLGPPGTGKTTVARIIGKIYKRLGLLKSGHVVETDRADLVAHYLGQTAGKVDAVVRQALGGVLFIDEAYSLVPSNLDHHDYGQEALDALIKRMEDHRTELAVIVAGYPDEMKHFIESNPGLKSRISRNFSFRHYNATELMQIFEGIADASDYEVSSTARTRLMEILTAATKEPERTFGNGRYVRNLFGKIVERHASRIAPGDCKRLSNTQLNCITVEDIPRGDPAR